jgi:DNA-directed RNA polymerase subunit M/transcription elongation factor TFIIS
MNLRFCPKCKTLMHPSQKNNSLVCNSCGYIEELKELVSMQKIKSKKIGEGYISDKNEFADYEHKCPKCGYNKVQIIDLGVFYSDEDHIILLKCGRCKWSEKIGKIS